VPAQRLPCHGGSAHHFRLHQDEYLGALEVLVPGFEPLGVPPSRRVGVVHMGETGRGLILPQSLDLAGESPVLGRQGRFEWQCLGAEVSLVQPGGIGPLDRVAQNDDDARAGDQQAGTACRVRVGEVIRRGIKRHAIRVWSVFTQIDESI
jgi:hypothetical protein